MNIDDEQAAGRKSRSAARRRTGDRPLPWRTGISGIRREFAGPLLALAAIVGAVLLIACSNVANLLLARGAARSREMTLRASIGAGRGRLLQQVLVESSVLTLAATVLGLVCAMAAVPLIVGMLTTNENPVYLDTRLDWRVLAFVAALGCLTTVLFGLAPAIRASAASPAAAAAYWRQKPDREHRHGPVAGRGADRFQPDDPVRCGSPAALVRPVARRRSRLHARRCGPVVGRSAGPPRAGAGARGRAPAAGAGSGVARRRERQPLGMGTLQGLVVGQQHGASRGRAGAVFPAGGLTAVLPDDGDAARRRPRACSRPTPMRRTRWRSS